MKTLIRILLVIIIFPQILKSQIIEFAPLNSTWRNYNSYDVESVISEYFTEKDTIIQGNNCKYVKETFSFDSIVKDVIFFQDSLKVYRYVDGEFDLIIDFGLEIGDTLKTYKIVEVDTIELDGRMFPRQKIRSIYDSLWMYYSEFECIVFPLGFMQGEFFDYVEIPAFQPFIFGPPQLACYKEDGFSTTLVSGNNCDWLLGEEQVNFEDIIITPEGQIILDDSRHIELIQIYSMSGQLIISLEYIPDSNIDLNNLHRGVYVVRINFENGMKSFKKVIIN